MDARNFFSSITEPFKRNQYGAAGGGYVKRDKLFFYGNFERFNQRLGVVQRGTFPTQTLLSGNFAGRALQLAIGGWQLNTIVSWQTGAQRSVTSTNLTGISYVTQRADATAIAPDDELVKPQPGGIIV